jgi:hypothetical protein
MTKTKKELTLSPRSTAVKTKMLTVCKGCGKPNGNGYQYCTACNIVHNNKRKKITQPGKTKAKAKVKSSDVAAPRDKEVALALREMRINALD